MIVAGQDTLKYAFANKAPYFQILDKHLFASRYLNYTSYCEDKLLFITTYLL